MERKYVPRYDKKFRERAVRMVAEQGYRPAEVAKELQLPISTVRRWLESEGLPSAQVHRLSAEEQRIAELEAENHALRVQLREKEETIKALNNSMKILVKERSQELI